MTNKIRAAYREMVRSCYHDTHKDFPQVGGNGIGVELRWRKSFAAFESDMGPPLKRGDKIMRRDTRQSFNRENCYWGTDNGQKKTN